MALSDTLVALLLYIEETYHQMQDWLSRNVTTACLLPNYHHATHDLSPCRTGGYNQHTKYFSHTGWSILYCCVELWYIISHAQLVTASYISFTGSSPTALLGWPHGNMVCHWTRVGYVPACWWCQLEIISILMNHDTSTWHTACCAVILPYIYYLPRLSQRLRRSWLITWYNYSHLDGIQINTSDNSGWNLALRHLLSHRKTSMP